MFKSLVFFIFFITAFQIVCFAQSDSLQSRIVLIGDAGELTNGRQPVVSGVRSSIPLDEKTTIIFLGDNLYKVGLPDDLMPTYDLAKAPLDSQIDIAKGTKAKVFFIPGNHDWNNGSRNGYEAILREQRYVDLLGEGKNVKFYPEDGCPGPVEVNITDDVVLLIIDSQWWVHPYDKPGIESDCPYKTKNEVLAQIEDILNRNSKKLVVFALHHTLRSYGIHGGYFTWIEHIFPLTDAIPWLYLPLPVLGSVYPITRGIFGTSEDLRHPLYADMIHDLDNVVKTHQNVIFTAGHEHTMQLIKDSGQYYMVSGSGSKSTRVFKGKNTVFRSQKNGFATLEISKNKTVRAKYFTVENEKVENKYDSVLLNFSTLPTPENPKDTQRTAEIVFKDSVLISASDKYKNPTGFKKFFLGENYREEWSTPVKLKVFNLRKEKGGFKIESLGGGKQTKSLRLKDKNGKEWTLRTIDKDPEKALPENLRGTLAQRIVQDLISSSNPYAPLVVASLSKAAGIVEATPEFFFVPDDPAFGFYQKMFASTVCLLEEREPTPGSSNTKSTSKVINNIVDDHDDHIAQNAYLKARLLDNLIGDWDRHFDQWKWGTADTGKGKLFYPVPRDRDQAFFYSDGLLMSYISKYRMRYLQSFKKTIADVNWFNWEARDIDNIFLNQLSKDDWRKSIDSFQREITDSVITQSINNLPPPIYQLDAKILAGKLAARRNNMMNEGMKWYNFLSKNVTVVGSNQRENFSIQKHGKGLELTVYKMKRFDTTGIMYHRIFDPSVTKEVRLYGLNGNDNFQIDADADSKIKVRIIGGKGKDSFDLKGNVRNYIYELSSEDNGIIHSHKSKINLSAEPMADQYKATANEYNISQFPHMRFGFNPEDKLLVGFGFSRKTYGFRKEPYATFQKVSSLFAINHLAYQLKYEGIFNSVFLKKDLLVNAEFVNPTLNNFFGMGNETVYNKTLPLEFYRVRYKYVTGEVLLRKQLNEVLSIAAGPSYYHYWIRYDDNKTRILGKPSMIGSDSASIYSIKDYFGGKLKIDINYVNNPV
ncbi:MAG: metallophosphoesterase, partial [Ginsengibacter sp.]